MNPQQPNSRNLYIAIALCIAIMVLWEMFFIAPRMDAERTRLAAQKKATEQTAPVAPASPGERTAQPHAPSGPGAGRVLTREDALRLGGGRIKFDTKSIDGSISLKGARIDDLRLKAYRETIDRTSPEIVLLSPKGSRDAYFAEFGWTAAAGSTVALPNTDTVWTVEGAVALAEDRSVTLTWENAQGLRFTRIVSVDANYMFTVIDSVDNSGASALTLFPYASVTRRGMPASAGNWILHEGMVGNLNETLSKETYSDLLEASEVKTESPSGWLGITDKYWMAALIPPKDEKFNARYAAFPDATTPSFQADYLLQARTLAPGAKISVEHKFFAGAKVNSIINAYETKFAIPQFDNAIDWGWFWFLTKPIFWLLDLLNQYLGNFGLAILALTVVIKGLFFPLANRSYEAMSKLKKVQPELKELQERNKDDRVKLQTEMMALYRREKINPMMGCLPILIQIPVFFSLYKVLFVTIEMRHAPFFGWIQDLAAPDPTSIFNLFGLLPFAVPAFLLIGVWPILMGLSMWLQTKMNPPAQDPMQQQMLNWMPWIFMFMLASFPAGLVIYWVWNNILSIAQQYVIMRKTGTPIEVIDNLKIPAWLNGLLGRRGPGPLKPGE
jgi:YidC/Oxa1 family membrane protein insertase